MYLRYRKFFFFTNKSGSGSISKLIRHNELYIFSNFYKNRTFVKFYIIKIFEIFVFFVKIFGHYKTIIFLVLYIAYQINKFNKHNKIYAILKFQGYCITTHRDHHSIVFGND